MEIQKRVLVHYESTPDGRAALAHAAELARRHGGRLTVVSVATRERVDIGCLRCRQSAAIWNREMRLIAEEDIAEAATLVESAQEVEYRVEVGKLPQAIAAVAHETGTDVIVAPWERSRRLRQLASRTVSEQLRQTGWEVVVAPRAAAKRRHAPVSSSGR